MRSMMRRVGAEALHSVSVSLRRHGMLTLPGCRSRLKQEGLGWRRSDF